MRYLYYLTSLLIFCACVTRQDENAHSFRSYKEDGVPIAETTGGPKYEGELFEYIEVLRLIEDSGIPESYLADPGLFVRDNEGHYYVPDERDRRIAVFDSDGRYIRSFGREGSGPGEFQTIAIQAIHGNALSLLDRNLNRTTIYNTEGELLDVYSFPQVGSPLESLYKTSDGIIIGVDYPYKLGIDVEQQQAKVVTTTLEGDTLAVLKTDLVDIYYMWQTSDGRRYGRTFDFCGHPMARYDPVSNRILLNSGISTTLQWFYPSGELAQIIRIDIPLDPITAADRAPIIKQSRLNVQYREGLAKEFEKARHDALQFKQFKGFSSRFFIDDRGYIWIKVPENISTDTWPGRYLYHVLDPDGVYLGDTRLPKSEGFVMDGYLLQIVGDKETGASIPTVFQIRPIPMDFAY